MKYPFPKLTKKQRRALDLLGCGDFTLSGISQNPKHLLPFLQLFEMGLVEVRGEKSICRDAFGEVKVYEYQMPPAIHMQWCEYQSAQYEKDNK